jgi:hypothetical protein
MALLPAADMLQTAINDSNWFMDENALHMPDLFWNQAALLISIDDPLEGNTSMTWCGSLN